MARQAMSRLSWQGPRRFQLASWVVMLAAVFFPVRIVHAADALSSNSASANTITASLKYQETAYSVINWNVSLTRQTTPFKKEPQVSGKIIRGVLNFRGDTSNAIPFVWERNAQKLYLDLNRNRDLTDDPAGVFSAREARPESYQTFTNVHLFLNTASGRSQVLADVSLYDYGSRPGCNLAVRSFWQGKMTLQGQDWQVGIVPGGLNPSDLFKKGYLLLRPWEKRNRSFNAFDGLLASVPCSRKLFLDGHAYELSLGSKPPEGETMTLRFREQSVSTGELKITGKYIQRLVLRAAPGREHGGPGGPYLAVLDQPSATVRVPVGTYHQPDVLLERSSTEAYCRSSQGQSRKRISVDDKAPTILAVGGPLTNSVTATRHGQDLLLNYQLLGAGGAAFQLAHRDYSKPPEFTIYKDGKKIASGKFQYG